MKFTIVDRVNQGKELPALDLESFSNKPPRDLLKNPYYSRFLEMREQEGIVKTKKFPEMKEEFLQELANNGGFITIAESSLGYYQGCANYYRKADALFDQAVGAIKGYYDEARLDELEKLSCLQASQKQNITERIFQLKALHPEKYRDKQPTQATQINVMVSGTNPRDRLKVISKLAKQ